MHGYTYTTTRRIRGLFRNKTSITSLIPSSIRCWRSRISLGITLCIASTAKERDRDRERERERENAPNGFAVGRVDPPSTSAREETDMGMGVKGRAGGGEKEWESQDNGGIEISGRNGSAYFSGGYMPPIYAPVRKERERERERERDYGETGTRKAFRPASRKQIGSFKNFSTLRSIFRSSLFLFFLSSPHFSLSALLTVLLCRFSLQRVRCYPVCLKIMLSAISCATILGACIPALVSRSYFIPIGNTLPALFPLS